MVGSSGSSGSYEAPEFVAMAHRGGALLPANLGIENTLEAFRNAVSLGFRYLETDVHATRDGKLVAFHDAELHRVTDVPGRIADLTFDEVRGVRVGGREQIPSVDELFEAFPDCLFNLDLKAAGSATLLADQIRRHGAEQRVCVGSFSSRRIRRFRRLLPEVTTAVSSVGVAVLVGGVVLGADGDRRVYQVPLTHQVGPFTVDVLTPARIRAIHRAGRKVHVWTINSPDKMHELIDWGVDGIVTDRPDLLKGVLTDRGMWSTR